MDKKKSILNVSVSVCMKLVLMILSIVVKRMLIRTCGNEVNGLNSLYLSIIGFLSVAELGIGTAIVFCMYKPIVEGNQNQVSALYQLFQKVYLIIGVIILAAGLILTPFIHHFAKDYVQLNVNMRMTFVLMLVSVVITYFFGAKMSLINAYKDNYITTAISSGGVVLQYLLQIIVLRVSGSFDMYLICRIASAVAQWGVTELIVRRKHGAVMRNKQRLDAASKQSLTRNVKAMFMHKVGSLLVNTVDSLVISAFVGVVALGKYSNYTSILISMDSVLVLMFSSLTSVFGHLYAEKNKETARAYFEQFRLLNQVIGVVFYLGYFAIIDNLIAILFSESLVVERSVSLVIALNGFVQFMRQNTLTFREATGTFYNDRWKPLVEGGINIVLSILFVKIIGVVGVIVATILTNLLICHVIEPFVLYRYAFESSPKGHYLRNYLVIAAFTVVLLVFGRCMLDLQSQWAELFVNGFLSVGVSAVMCAIVALLNKEACRSILDKLRRRK